MVTSEHNTPIVVRTPDRLLSQSKSCALFTLVIPHRFQFASRNYKAENKAINDRKGLDAEQKRVLERTAFLKCFGPCFQRLKTIVGLVYIPNRSKSTLTKILSSCCRRTPTLTRPSRLEGKTGGSLTVSRACSMSTFFLRSSAPLALSSP